MRKRYNCILSLGSNIENKIESIKKSIEMISELKGIFIIKSSAYYYTSPVGYLEQNAFINCVLQIKSELMPYKLLEEINKIEKDLGRERNIRWGPRTIDIDIIFYGEMKIRREDLIIPHKEYKNRNFVLVPLMELKNFRRFAVNHLDKGIGTVKKIEENTD